MANNRMYLRCRTCGNIFFLGKCFGEGYYTSNIYYDGKTHYVKDVDDNGTPDAFLDAYNEFLDKHAYCTEPLNESEIRYIDTPFKKEDSYYQRFEICYEIDYEKGDKEERIKKVSDK